jgi:hypothetical protein
MVVLPGSTSHNPFDNSFVLSGSGADVWGTVDAFRYSYVPLAGNGSIVARLDSFNGPHPWSKAGVMMRLSTSPTAAHAFLLWSRDHGLAFQRRTAGGGLTTHTAGPALAQWLRLTRSGDLVTAATSHDGVNWTDVDTDVLPAGGGPLLVGLAITSHDIEARATAHFRQVEVTAD